MRLIGIDSTVEQLTITSSSKILCFCCAKRFDGNCIRLLLANQPVNKIMRNTLQLDI